jgi:hypothetical protein
MKLRIVTATRGDSPFWDDMIRSVRACASDAEHVIVCPPAAMRALAASAPAARLVAETGTGLYAALNQGWREPPGDWEAFTWLNDDDRFEPGLGSAWREMQAQPESGISYGRVRLIGGEGQMMGWQPVASRPDDLVPLLIRGVMPLAQPGTLIRRRVMEAVGALDQSYRLAGDLDFFVRALVAGVRFSHCDAVVAQFRLRAGQLSKHEAIAATEFDRAVAPLRAGNSSAGLAALARFRWTNRGVYWDRWRRHGGVTMREMYRRE